MFRDAPALIWHLLSFALDFFLQIKISSISRNTEMPDLYVYSFRARPGHESPKEGMNEWINE